MEVDGKLISEYVSFSQYMDIVLTHQQTTFTVHGAKVGTTGELGSFGYVVALLQIVGFAFGAVAVFGYLMSLPYCQTCSRYLKSKAKQTRYAENAENFTLMVQRLAICFENDRLQIALDEHGGFGQAKLPEGGYLMSSIRRRECPVCHISHSKFTPSKLVRN
jgi:hypothetical protein